MTITSQVKLITKQTHSKWVFNRSPTAHWYLGQQHTVGFQYPQKTGQIYYPWAIRNTFYWFRQLVTFRSHSLSNWFLWRTWGQTMFRWWEILPECVRIGRHCNSKDNCADL